MKINNLRNHLFVLSLSLLWSMSAKAHPVSYQGAWSLMNESTSTSRNLMLTHSLRYWVAPALTYQKYQEQQFVLGGVNLLAKRWNRPTSQGNFYLSVAHGVEIIDSDQTKKASEGAIDLDWEDRRFYTAARYSRILRDGSLKDIEMKKLRLGFAPYLGHFEELNTWFIVQATQMNTQTIEITPMLRFYYRNVLWEVGSSLRGQWLLNFMLHL